MRNYKRKTERGTTPDDVMKRAASLVLENEGNLQFSIRKVANDFNIHYSTLSRYISKVKKLRNLRDTSEMPKSGYAKARLVFTEEQESILVAYIKRSSDIMFGLDPISVRKLAYQCAVLHEIKIPSSWNENQQAGTEWLNLFLKRNSELSIRQPEATSLARATSFNPTNVKMFFEKLSDVLSRHPFEAFSIWNMDETGVSTVLRPRKIVAQKGMKQVGTITSAERGEMITVAVAVNAQGNSIPPMFIFPRKRFRDHFIRDGPPGCIGEANGSGWMQENTFFIFIQHFIKRTKPTKEKPVILLLDNHSSHLSCKVLDLCKESGVIMVSFPPHCSHKLQPLDLTVFGPFKKCCSSGVSAWLKSNPGNTITIFDLPEIIEHAFLNAVNPKNIVSGFKAAGIFPLNPNIFVDSDFASSFVTDRPAGESQQSNDFATPGSNAMETSETVVREPEAVTPNTSATFSPESVRPFPKAVPRLTTNNRGRKRRKTAILTDTPEKRALEDEERIRNEKNRNKIEKASGSNQSMKSNVKKRPEVRKLVNDSSDEESLMKKIKNKSRKRVYKKVADSESSSEDDNTACLVCDELYDENNVTEDWLQCTQCKRWAHGKCAKDNPFYVCLNCLSECSTESD